MPGPCTFRSLINHFGGAGAALSALPDLARRGGPINGQPADLPAQEPESFGPGPVTEPDGDERNRIVALLGPTPVAIDDLIRISGSSPAIVRTVLLELEIAGRLERAGAGMASLASP